MEYTSTLTLENDDSIELTNTDISYLSTDFQKGFFGDNVNKFKKGIEKVIINKKYIISCDK